MNLTEFFRKIVIPYALKILICAALLIVASLPTHFETESAMRSRTRQTRNTDLYFSKRISKVEEHCLRKDLAASHIYIDSESDPYFFFAFPAKNSGVGLWFNTKDKNVFIRASAKPQAVMRDHIHGAEIQLRTSTKELNVTQAVLGNMRFIRNYELGSVPPPEVNNHTFKFDGHQLVIHRHSLNQLAEYQIEIEPLKGTKVHIQGNHVRFESDSEVKFIVRGLTSERPLTPLDAAKVFKKKFLARMDRQQLEGFSFLLYAEKFAAGSPRYLTQFGRDALITLYVLMEAMNPEAIEDLISATAAGMHPSDGHVSHEQSEGDFVSYARMKAGEKYIGIDTPIENYKMIDDDYIFPIVVAEYMKRYPERVHNFLQRKDPRGITMRKLILRNFNFVMDTTKAFAQRPIYKNLIRIEKGEAAGQWRDSDNGLGGGVYPFDVNAALVPGALKALSDVYEMKELDFYDAKIAQKFSQSYKVWNTKVLPLFEIHMPTRKLASIGSKYFNDLKINLQNLPPPPMRDLRFPGIALKANGSPIPIMHSDDSLMMTFGYPSADYIKTVTQRIHEQFPYGLKTPVGILVANPVFASDTLKRDFDEKRYHGRVSWAMQEDLLLFGFERQMALQEFSPQLLEDVHTAMKDITKAIRAKGHMGGNEVFSVLFVDGKYLAQPFTGDAKSNSNQLWSHLRIASPALSDESDEHP